MKTFVTIALLVFVAACHAAVKEEAPKEEYVEEENENMVEGDMILSPYQKFLHNNGMLDNSFSSSSRIWDKRYPIPYVIESSLRGSNGERMIRAAIADYHKYTCLRFTPRSRQSTYLSFYKGGGCSSYVGYGRGKRPVSLASGCWRKGTVLHEMGHAIGLYHEQSRTDRDSYITIIWNNIKSAYKSNFNKAAGTTSHGTPYDYDSMMHYPGSAFSSNRGVTIRTKDSRYQNRIGQRTGFSKWDIVQINKMYKCTSK